jgi:hypothetical protein
VAIRLVLKHDRPAKLALEALQQVRKCDARGNRDEFLHTALVLAFHHHLLEGPDAHLTAGDTLLLGIGKG